MTYDSLLKKRGFKKEVFDRNHLQYVKTHLDNYSMIRITKCKGKIVKLEASAEPICRSDKPYGIEAKLDYDYLLKEANMLVKDIKEMYNL